MGSHDPFGDSTHKLWPKEGSGVKLAVWLPPTKSQESPQFPCVHVACDIPLKSSWQGLQLCFRTHLNQRSTDKIMGPQSCRKPNFGNFGTPTWGPGTKCHLGGGPMARHRVLCKGADGGFPQVWTVVDLVNLNLFMVHLNTKIVPTMH
jgi:hypothetical protein